ncbi:two-component sensor histidine kinase [Burkholderia sp. WAC0059]|uniref:ATP-binding protein n=1 Tax=Burkholderia sp. WAC0059 TaxID=2066022 RepID=UPI000C7EE324|nr:ATP-binding protein [Burkholderia sp. WAC0059]PLZ02524.1 two-component sensor histidine kinase [Burkholderia sp. WAC0059]
MKSRTAADDGTGWAARARAVARACRSYAWPHTLFGRLVIILVAGMFAGQLLTSTIWFETHDNRALEIPVRLFASRLADSVRLLDATTDREARRALASRLGDAHYTLTLIDGPAAEPPLNVAGRATRDLLASVMRERLGAGVPVRLVEARLRDDRGRPRGILALFDSCMPMGEFRVETQLADGTWLDAHGLEGQAGMVFEPHALVLDYLLRIYFVRLLAVFAFALVAVRFAVGPLRQLADAARALGRDIHRPPLPETGPLEVRSAARSLNSMQQQLIESIGTRTRVLAAVSHDLRSPITRLRLRAEMLGDAEARERFRTDLADMEAMVQATLEFVQGVEVTQARHNVDIDSLLRALGDDYAEAGEAVSVEGRAARPVPGYPRNLKRCLQNLIDNAIRYGGGRAAVCVEDSVRELRIVVSDDGPGIHGEGMLERVFEPYFRVAGSRNAATGGTGLGLSIARTIAVAHGGTLVLRNRAQGGLDAILTLPREAASAQRNDGGPDEGV